MSQEIVARLLTAGRKAWPSLELDAAALAEHLATLPSAPAPASDEAAAELYLAAACARAVRGAQQTLEEYCAVELRAVLRRHGAGEPNLRDDALQATRSRLFVAPPAGRAAIADYAGRGSLKGWVRVVATRAVVDLLRAPGHREAAASDALERLFPSSGNPELELLKRKYRDQFPAVFRSAVAQLTARERNLLRQHYTDDLGIDDLALLYRVHRATVARWLVAARTTLLSHMRKALARELNLSPVEADSVLRLIRSQLHVSMAGLAAP